MSQTLFGSNSTPSLPVLDANFTQLYDWRELVSTPSYGAATPKYDATTGGWVLVGGGALGYGVGSGGTVTQATSKSNSVTLNKPSGQITTNAASLGAGATVSFTFNNSFLAATDTMVCHVSGAAGGAQSYNVYPYAGAAGAIVLALKNITGGALAESVVINFAIIKGATT